MGAGGCSNNRSTVHLLMWGQVGIAIGHIANSIFLVTGGRKEPMTEIFAGNQLETSIAVHTNHYSPSLVLYKLILLCEINLDL